MSRTTTTPRRGARTRQAGRSRPDLSAVLDLLDRSEGTLAAARCTGEKSDRYVQAHLGAHRAAAAFLASRPRHGGTRMRNVWESLTECAPEFTEWADYFAAGGRRRADLELGGDPVSAEEAADMLRAGTTFHRQIRAALGLPVDRAPVPA